MEDEDALLPVAMENAIGRRSAADTPASPVNMVFICGFSIFSPASFVLGFIATFLYAMVTMSMTMNAIKLI